MAQIRKQIKINPIDLLEFILGEEAKDHKDTIEKYRQECELDAVTVDLVLGEHEYFLTNLQK